MLPHDALEQRDPHARGRLLLFGGNDGSGYRFDTWEYAPLYPASFIRFGSGCAGSAGAPALAAASGNLPWLGGTFRLEVSRLPAAGLALLLPGGSGTAWGSIPLPLDLSSMGMPGCTLFVSGPLILPVLNTGGAGSVSFPVPGDPVLLAGSFYNQAFVADPPANAAGIIASNAGEGRIGAK